MDEKKLEAARRAKARVRELVPDNVEVVGIGIGLSGSDPAIKVNLRTAPGQGTILPNSIDGVPVVYDIIGKISPR